jgi:hypothetical protein
MGGLGSKPGSSHGSFRSSRLGSHDGVEWGGLSGRGMGGAEAGERSDVDVEEIQGETALREALRQALLSVSKSPKL